MSQDKSIDECKQDLRLFLRKCRNNQSEKETSSHLIFQHLQDLDIYSRAQTILFYVDARDEVRTQAAIQAELANSTKVVIPYCQKGQLKLIELKDFNELSSGAFGILEPNSKLRQQIDRSVAPAQIDVALIPGLGFDRHGGRIGHGKGYYDRLIPELREDCCRIGIAFDCQIMDQIPISKYDQFMNLVVTESEIITCVQG